VTSPRALSLLAAFASPIFMLAAVAGWLTGRLPANPITFGIAAFLIVAGPLAGLIHVAMTRDEDDEEEELEPTVVLPQVTRVIPQFRLPEPPVPPELAAARAFHNWRDSGLPALEERAREEQRARRPYARL
jgi:hypothetical protein